MPNHSFSSGPDAIDIAAYLLDLAARGYDDVVITLRAIHGEKGPRLTVVVDREKARSAERWAIRTNSYVSLPDTRFNTQWGAIWRALYLFDRKLADLEHDGAMQARF